MEEELWEKGRKTEKEEKDEEKSRRKREREEERERILKGKRRKVD